ncbi:UDP-N-acetylglucosamine 2-epimerase [Idiomarina aminovorans]|uniref:UDP-N-acetylglucosamine 2-epimerase n=1 Tax=Idiomarina aminovorans TaxID=2914829 RepID=UPI002004419E|nr:UDP-N-acetylglucosamine 2-epimerase [Idiomarina sp. ATCH4]MCK7459128.1 UDP-N-acetylglucosamine 2-epimerase [Idiomarina sp. ATCH4]
MKRRIAVFTGTRAEYGLLYWIIKGLKESSKVDLLLFAGGMHLSPEFGKTINQIENDGFKVTEQLEFLLSSDSPVGIAKSMGLAMISAADSFQRTKPDMLVVLGDRYEALAVCQAAMAAQIPIAHIHGGETTEGLIDEAVRHSITKMSHLHFTATEDYRKRVIQLGEPPATVYNFGAPGIDSIKKLKLLERNELSDAIEFNVLDTPFMVVTYHPVTLNKDGAINDFKNLLLTLEKCENFKFIITYPNADTFGRSLIVLLEEFKEKHPDKVLLTKSLGQLRYLSVLKHSELTIGNSSSGLIEAPSFRIPTVNIGDRQRGRVAGDTVINCEGDAESINKALDKALSSSFKEMCAQSKNPYGDGESSRKILNTLLNTDLDNLVYKKFYDLS